MNTIISLHPPSKEIQSRVVYQIEWKRMAKSLNIQQIEQQSRRFSWVCFWFVFITALALLSSYAYKRAIIAYKEQQIILSQEIGTQLDSFTSSLSAKQAEIEKMLPKLALEFSTAAKLSHTSPHHYTVSYWDGKHSGTYTNAPWFIASKFTQKGSCYWTLFESPSLSARCTTPIRHQNGQFTGALTIDYPLENFPYKEGVSLYLSNSYGELFMYDGKEFNMIHEELYSSLPQDIFAFRKAGKKAIITQRKLYQQSFNTLVADFKKSGITSPIAEEIADGLLFSELIDIKSHFVPFSLEILSSSKISQRYVVPSLGWTILTSKKVSYKSLWRDLREALYMVLGATILFYITIIRYMKRYVFGPIHHITEGFEKGRDISEKKMRWLTPLVRSYNEQLENLKVVDHRKSRFLANVSHEIRTPLNGIMGLSQLLSQSRLNGQQKQYVGAIIRSGKSLLQIVNDILDLSRIEADRMTITNAPFNMQTVMKDIYDLMQAQAAQKGLLFTFNVPDRFPLILEGDALRFRQVITNLVGNALKFTEKGFVEMEIDSFDIAGKKCHFTLTVSDSGPGISEELQKNLFETYVRGEKDHRKHIEGTGLGLALCKKLVELMGGYIHLESSLANGSRFTIDITLPISTKLAAEIEEISDEKAATLVTKNMAPKDILVVDDSQVNMMFAEALLRKWGHHVYKAENGKEAIQLLADHPVDLVFMDVQMPEMDGIEATQFIRQKLTQNQDVPIVALTANATAGEDTECLEAGMNDYLSKPFAEDQMEAILQKWTQKGEKNSIEF